MRNKWLKIGILLIAVSILIISGLLSGAIRAEAKSFKPDPTRDTVLQLADLQLTIPAGATNREISVCQDDTELNGIQLPYGFKAISKPYRFGPDGLKFPQNKNLLALIKIDLAALPEGYSLNLVKLYYINHETGRLEVVPDQRMNQETSTLEANLRHFSSYIAGVAPGWDGNGLNSYFDYINHGEESVLLYGSRPNVLSRMFSLAGRGGMDLNLDRAYSFTGVEPTNPFFISNRWYWALLYYDIHNSKLYFPGGASYSAPNYCSCSDEFCNCAKISGEGGVLFEIGYDMNHCIDKIYLKDGTVIDPFATDEDHHNCQTVTNSKGNQIRYYFSGNFWEYDETNRITSLVDSAGRTFYFQYAYPVSHFDAGYGVPVLTKVEQELSDRKLRTILTRTLTEVDDDNCQENFTNVLGNTTSYYCSEAGLFSYGSNLLNKVVYPNGTVSQYQYDNFINRSYWVKKQMFFRPGATTPFRTLDYTNLGDVTVNDGSCIKKYEFDYWGQTTREETSDLAGHLLKRIDNSYSNHRPSKVVTTPVNSDGTFAAEAVYEYEYDNLGNTTKITDPKGTVTYMAYPKTGFPINNIFYSNSEDHLSSINPLYEDALYTTGAGYNQMITKATLVTDTVHNTTQLKQTHFQYDTHGNLLRESVAYNGTHLNTLYTYDQFGNRLSQIDAKGNELRFEYSTDYNSAYLTRVYKPDNTTLATYSHSFNKGKPTAVTDPNGNNFIYTYDLSGRLTSETLDNSTSGIGVTRELTYDDLNNTVSIRFGSDQGGWQEGQIIYDSLFGKPKTIQRKLSGNWVIIKKFSYDTNGRVAWEKDNLGHKTSYTYDPLDRLVTTTFPDGTATTSQWNGRVVTTTDALGNQRRQTYNKLDWLTKVEEFLDPATIYQTSYIYDNDAHLLQVTNPRGAVTKNTYDCFGRLVRTDYPQDGANPLAPETFTYDNVGNLKTKTGARGTKTIKYEFFAGYRIQKVTEPDGRIVNYTYDPNDNVLTQTSPGGSYTYTYDARNRMKTYGLQLDGYNFNLAYDYDVFGRMTNITYPNRVQAVSYNYDELDRLQSIPGFVSSCSYDGDNKLTNMLFGNGINNHYDYRTNDDKLADIQVGPSGSLLSLNYTYDAVGNIKQINNDYYRYDGLYRLIWAGDSLTSKTGNGTAWTYDSAGNMSSKESYLSGVSQGNVAFTCDLANRLWTMGSKTYINDTAGARTGKTDMDSWAYIYDGELRLTQVNKNGASMLDNVYDGAGMRVKEISNGQTTYTIYQGNNPLMEYSQADGKYKYFVYAGNERIAEEKVGIVNYYHCDQLESTRLVTGVNGVVVASYKFKPYGETDSYSGAFSTDYQFTGKPINDSSGLNYFGGRWYDAESCRFTSIDPAKVGANWYSYCSNNPVTRIDPDGNSDLSITTKAMWAVTELVVSTVAKTISSGVAIVADSMKPEPITTQDADGNIIINQDALDGICIGLTGGIEVTGEKIATEIVQRVMSEAELKATESTGLLRGGREGAHFASDAISKNAVKARQRLALEKTPKFRVTMEVPAGKFSKSAKVASANNMPGGGSERTATGNIIVKILEIFAYKK
jgi:RHS repeat-associated protein